MNAWGITFGLGAVACLYGLGALTSYKKPGIVRDMEMKTVADLTRALGLPDYEQDAVAAFTGESTLHGPDGWVPRWTEAEMADLVRIWHEVVPDGAE